MEFSTRKTVRDNTPQSCHTLILYEFCGWIRVQADAKMRFLTAGSAGDYAKLF